MDKQKPATNITVKSAKTGRRPNTKRPQVLDLRPGHIRAVAAMQAEQPKNAQPIDGLVRTKGSQPSTVSRPGQAATPNNDSSVTVKVSRPAKPAAKAEAKPVTAKPKPVHPAVTAKPTKPTKPAKSTKATSETAKPSATPKNAVDKWARQARRKLDKTLNTVSKHGHRFILDRWDHIRMARRDVLIWLSLVLVLIIGSFAQTMWFDDQLITTAAASGGTYIEGVVDKLTTISPLYANTDTEKAASQLVYPGLLSYDDTNRLHGELAESWSMDDAGKVWTVKLKPALTWSDGQPLTADDVVYTVNLMKDANINANLSNSWQTIEATATNDQTVEFKLANPLISFNSALTFGVLPKHILDGKKSIAINSLFSQSPRSVVGAGPYQLDKIETTTSYSIWHFKPNPKYYDSTAKISSFAIRTYNDNDSLINSLKRGEVNAISSVKAKDINQFDRQRFKVVQLKTANGVYALFNNDGELTSDSTIRAALRLGLDRSAIRNKLTENNQQLRTPTDLETPIATGVYSSIDQLKQPDYNLAEAQKLLDQAGWTLTSGQQYRHHGDQELAIKLVTIAGTNYEIVTQAIANQWRQLGVNATVESVSPSQAQQNYLVPRNYDVLVYQMHLGADPDMFAYWSSTQTQSTGLNLANYRSRRAELALSAGRTNANADAREARYVAFVNQWLADNPAIALYQPSLFYVMRNDLQTLHDGDSIIDASNRFVDVSTWTAATAPVMTTP